MDAREADQQLEKLIRAANAALLGDHATMGLAYVAQRLNLLEDENRRLSRKVLMLEDSLTKARDFLREMKRKTDGQIKAVDAAATNRTAASEAEMLARIEALTKTEPQDEPGASE